MTSMTTNELARATMPRTVVAADAVIMLDEVGSTNTYARELMTRGNGYWPFAARSAVAVVAAERQTAGRGRLDHAWVSDAHEPAESFTVSFVVCVPRALATDTQVNGWLQMIAGLSALDAIRAAMRMTGPDRLRLKWPNDLFCDGLKLGGILAELVTLSNEPDHVALVFGIGINLAVPADRLPTPQSTSLLLRYGMVGGEPVSGTGPDGADSGVTDHVAMDPVALRDAIAAGIVRSLRSRLGAFETDPRGYAARLLAEARPLCWTLGHRVEIHYADGTAMLGDAVALNADASLTVRDDAGATHIVRTADVGVLSR